MNWKEDQAWEKNWWLSDRPRHAFELAKSALVGQLLMLGTGVPTKSVIDIGSGPLSLLLRLQTRSGTALDPMYYEDLEHAYTEHRIARLRKRGEDLCPNDGHWDEAWIYNCLQHVEDPGLILRNVLQVADMVRIFEWTYTEPSAGHPQRLTPELLRYPFITAGWSRHLESTGRLDHELLLGDYFVGIYSRPK